MSKIELGYKRSGEFFKYNNKVYKIGHLIENTNGYVACTDVITHKTTRFHLDLEVEELQESEAERSTTVKERNMQQTELQ